MSNRVFTAMLAALVVCIGVAIAAWYFLQNETPEYLAEDSLAVLDGLDHIAAETKLRRAIIAVGGAAVESEPEGEQQSAAMLGETLTGLSATEYKTIEARMISLLDKNNNDDAEDDLSEQEIVFWQQALSKLQQWAPIAAVDLAGQWFIEGGCQQTDDLLEVTIAVSDNEMVIADDLKDECFKSEHALPWRAKSWQPRPAMNSFSVEPTTKISIVDRNTLQGAGLVFHRRLQYQNDFETKEVGSEWSRSLISTTPSGREFLGKFANDRVILQLESLPKHRYIVVSFDLFVMASWDGNDLRWGPDIWTFIVDDSLTLVNASFSTKRSAEQSYPDVYQKASHPAYTGATERQTLGYEAGGVRDAVYAMHFSFPHDSDTVKLLFKGEGLQDITDESWGLDNIRVTTQFKE